MYVVAVKDMVRGGSWATANFDVGEHAEAIDLATLLFCAGCEVEVFWPEE